MKGFLSFIGTLLTISLLSCVSTPVEPGRVERPDPEPVVAAQSESEAAPGDEERGGEGAGERGGQRVHESIHEGIRAAVVSGDIDTAISVFEEAYTSHPAGADNQMLYANLLFSAGRFEEAESILETLLAGGEGHTEGLLLLSAIHGINGDEAGQEEVLLSVLELEPDHAGANAALGEIRLRNGMYESARESFEKSLVSEPDNIVALMGYGNVLILGSEVDRAIEQYDKVINQYPGYVFAYVDRSRAKSVGEDYLGAEEDLSFAIELEPEYYWHYIDRGKIRLLRLHDRAGALEDFNRAIAIDPGYFYPYIYRGGILDQEGDRSQAVEDYLVVLEARPDYRYLYAPVGVLLYMEERYGEAREYIQKAYEIDRNEHLFAFLIALAFKRDALDAGAKEFLVTAMREFPRDSLYYRLSRIFFEPSSIGQITGEVSREQNRDLKMKGLFVLATYSLLEGQTHLAQKYFLEVEDKAYYDSYERRLSTRELERFHR